MTEKHFEPLTLESEWTFDLIHEYYSHIERIASQKYGMKYYPNQIEVISSEQMLDAYASVGMPVNYSHWSFGKDFIAQHEQYKRGHMGLAYEIVINSNPCISYLMEENTMMMQVLVMAHACIGHNSFFRNNYLFKQWTNADSIIDYLVWAKKYIAECEEKYGEGEVEDVLDSCHALQSYGVDKYKRPESLSAADEEARRKEREDYMQAQLNDIWRTIPKSSIGIDAPDSKDRFPSEPQENILYFLEKNAPNMETWKREIVRIVRKLSQYFYPQMQTKLMNEGWACVVGNTLIDTPNGLLRADDIVNTKYNGGVSGRTGTIENIVQWHEIEEKERIKITLKNGFSLHGGCDHKILINNEWTQMQDLTIGDSVPIVRGDNIWPTSYTALPAPLDKYRLTLIEKCEEVGVHIKTYYKWLNHSSFVSEHKGEQCQEVHNYVTGAGDAPTSKIRGTRNTITLPKKLDEDFAYWLGLIVGDGGIYYGRNAHLHFTSGDEQLRDWFVNYSEQVLNVNVTVRSDRNHWTCKIYNINLVEYLVEHFNFITGRTASTKKVPDLILTSPQRVVASFLRGHFDTDGGVDSRSGNVILVSKSSILIHTEQEILLKMGIVSSVSLVDSDQCYRLTITGKDSARMMEFIGFNLTRKQHLLEDCHQNKKWYVDTPHVSEIVAIEHDFGPVYDFGVEHTHEYKASCFINHNCFWHYTLMHDLYEQGLITEGFMLEFYQSHTGVIAQLPFNHPYFNGINPYALGFAMFQDIKRIALNPTEEDKEWFGDQWWVGCGDWNKTLHWAMENFKDESFVQQFLSPNMMREFRMFSVVDDENDTKIEISAIHEKQGYRRVRDALSAQYNVGNHIPDIQVFNVDKWGDRSLTLRHYSINNRPLEKKDAVEVLKHLRRLWGFNIRLETVDTKERIRATLEVNNDETLMDIFLTDD